ncbi:MAG: helix-turn-helix domain-containing protein [Deltaproteobacteria bacterium]|nr:helix-turn-helix domain-containing protein [Deltaproteobacteria bacterium]
MSQAPPARPPQPPEGLEALGPTVQRLRRAAGYTLSALADESGIAKSILSRIENNETNPTLSTVLRLSQALNARVEELIGGEDARPALRAHLRPAQLPLLVSDDGLCELRITGDLDAVEWAQTYELSARPGGHLASSPHPAGTVESLYVREGRAGVAVGGERAEAAAGELLRYRGDLPHAITALGDVTLRATLVTLRRP